MDQDQFDNLARGLATNRFSRRQVFKSLTAGPLISGPLGVVLQACGKSREGKAEQAYAVCKGGCDPSEN